MFGFLQPGSLLKKLACQVLGVLVHHCPHHLQQTLPALPHQADYSPLSPPCPEGEWEQLTVDLEGSVSLVGPPFLCCNRSQTDYNPFMSRSFHPAPHFYSYHPWHDFYFLVVEGNMVVLGLGADPETRFECGWLTGEVIPRDASGGKGK